MPIDISLTFRPWLLKNFLRAMEFLLIKKINIWAKSFLSFKRGIKVLPLIKDQGHVFFPFNYFSLGETHIEEFDEIFNGSKHRIHGSNENIKILNNFYHFPKIYDVYKKIDRIVRPLKDIIKFEDVWVQKTNRDLYKEGELPFIPHIDKIRKFKVMIYLNEVNLETGALHLSKVSPEKYEIFRKNLKKDYSIRKENRIEDFSAEQYIPCLGPFGSTVFFDTNCPHYGGEFNKDKFRKVFRFNFKYRDN